LYDPAAGTNMSTGALNDARSYQTATLLFNGKVLTAGGYGDNGYLSSAELYDPAAGTNTPTGALNSTRSDHTATLLPNGQVLVMGGYNDTNDGLASAELYDPATGTWTTTSTMNTGRGDQTATLLASGKVLAVGGWDDNYDSSAESYDSGTVTANTLINPAKLPNGAFQFAFTGNPNGTNTVLTVTNPILPMVNWFVLGVVAEFSPGLFLFTDPQATNGGQRFFRIRSP